MSAINSSIYEDIEISAETTTGKGDTLDLRLGVVKFNYFEDLFSKNSSAKIRSFLLCKKCLFSQNSFFSKSYQIYQHLLEFREFFQEDHGICRIVVAKIYG